MNQFFNNENGVLIPNSKISNSNKNSIKSRNKNLDSLKKSHPVINLIVSKNSDHANSSLLTNLRPNIEVKMPDQKQPKPKLRHINSKQKISKSVCSSSLFVSSITSSLVSSQTDSTQMFLPLASISKPTSTSTKEPSSSRTASSKLQEKRIPSNHKNVYYMRMQQKNIYSENELKLGTSDHISKFLAFKDLRKSFKTLIDTSSEANYKIPINENNKTETARPKKQIFNSVKKENDSKFSIFNFNKTFSFATR